MKVFLVGANGQLGSEVLELANDSNIECKAFSSSELDITDHKKVSNLIQAEKPEIIINASAYTKVDDAEEQKDLAFKVNSYAIENLAKCALKNSSVLIHVSTDYVFCGSKKNGYDEKSKTNPKNIYGQSKLEGENHIRSILKKFFIIRTSWVFGKNGKNFIKTVINLAKKNNEINIVDDQYGKPTSASSLAKIILKICMEYPDYKKLDYGIYNFANSPSVSWYQFAQEICKEAFKAKIIKKIPKINPINSEKLNLRANRPQYSILNTSKIKNALFINDALWNEELKDLMYVLKNE